MESLQRLIEIEHETVCPAHGPVVPPPKGSGLIRWQYDHRARRETQVLDALKEGTRNRRVDHRLDLPPRSQARSEAFSAPSVNVTTEWSPANFKAQDFRRQNRRSPCRWRPVRPNCELQYEQMTEREVGCSHVNVRLDLSLRSQLLQPMSAHHDRLLAVARFEEAPLLRQEMSSTLHLQPLISPAWRAEWRSAYPAACGRYLAAAAARPFGAHRVRLVVHDDQFPSGPSNSRSMNPCSEPPAIGTPTGTSRQNVPDSTARLTMSLCTAAFESLMMSLTRPGCLRHTLGRGQSPRYRHLLRDLWSGERRGLLDLRSYPRARVSRARRSPARPWSPRWRPPPASSRLQWWVAPAVRSPRRGLEPTRCLASRECWATSRSSVRAIPADLGDSYKSVLSRIGEPTPHVVMSLEVVGDVGSVRLAPQRAVHAENEVVHGACRRDVQAA